MRSIVLSIIRNREMALEMARRDLKALNKGSFLGYAWLVISPLVQVAAYIVIVSFFTRSKNPDSGLFDYALYVLSGMIPWQIMTKSLQEAPTLVRERIELVKQVIYPIETLPLTSLIVGCFGSIITFAIFLALSIINGSIVWTYLFLPIPLFFLVIFVLGIDWIFSIVGVVIKDLKEFVIVALGLIVYLSPVVANEAMVGSQLWFYITLNPLSHIIICFRDVFWATFHPWSWIIFMMMSGVAFIVGGWMTAKTKLLINEYI